MAAFKNKTVSYSGQKPPQQKSKPYRNQPINLVFENRL